MRDDRKGRSPSRHWGVRDAPTSKRRLGCAPTRTGERTLVATGQTTPPRRPHRGNHEGPRLQGLVDVTVRSAPTRRVRPRGEAEGHWFSGKKFDRSERHCRAGRPIVRSWRRHQARTPHCNQHAVASTRDGVFRAMLPRLIRESPKELAAVPACRPQPAASQRTLVAEPPQRFSTTPGTRSPRVLPIVANASVVRARRHGRSSNVKGPILVQPGEAP